MTEEIIIDGVNVAGCHNKTPYKNDYGQVQCKCYRFEDIENDVWLLGICEQHPHCYYKQLKRLEQENKELKSNVLKWQKAFSRQYQINENKGYSKAEENYRSALEEIKNDLKEVCKEECDYTKPKFCGDCDCRYGQILNKINEVLK